VTIVPLQRSAIALSLLSLLTPLAAQKQKSEPITEQRLLAAYADARAACEKVLGAKLDELPPLRIVEPDEIATVVYTENLPAIRLRQPDEASAKAEAEQISKQLATMVYAKYAWSTRTFLIVPKTWELNVRILKRPQLTADHTLRAVMVHELCHALDDRKFDLGKRVLEATTVDAMTAFNAVLEGHAQLMTRRVCKTSGWLDGFSAFTDSIGALPENGLDEMTMFLLRVRATTVAAAYLEGERFATAVLDARPETGARDLFESPPKDAETILQPMWYLDPKTRPALLYDVEPAIDAFAARFDPKVWTSSRANATGKQLASGMTMLPKEDIDAVLASLRSARIVQLAPTAAPQSKIALLIVMEFDGEEAARRWVRLSGVISDHKDETMDKGLLRITDSKTTPLERPLLQGLMQQKQMKNGRLQFDVATIDAHKGRLVIETVYSGEPPTAEEHQKVVEATFAAIVLRK